MYKSTIVLDRDASDVEKLFSSEDKNLGRSRFSLKRNKGKLLFDIEADDATALKTVMNTIAKVFIVWEKTGELKY